MGEKKLNLTPEQEAAVGHRGGALLVSAAAGSGKTKVLVERLLSRIGEGDDIDEFLVITYTRASAAELRERIYDEILERLADTPASKRLRRQSILCRGASIDTIHGFCTDVLRENSHLAGFPPGFRIADESESGMIKAEVLEDVLEAAYGKIDDFDGLRQLVDLVSPGRDDKRLALIILDTHARLQSCPDPKAWAEDQMERLFLYGISDVSETVWGAYLMERARRTVFYRLREMEDFRERIRDFPEFGEKYGASIEASIDDIRAFLCALDRGWDEAGRCSLIDFSRVRPKPVSGYDDLKAIRLRCKAAMDRCAEMFSCTSEEYIEDMRAVAPAMIALLHIVSDFDNAYMEEKRRRGAVDFSDLEHLTLALLIDSETGERTGIARAVSRRFKEILVDEYQDVNAVQELIFNAVSQDGGNIFMVGDVKQSIYRFRLADPSIFMGKYERFRDHSESGPGDPVSGISATGSGISSAGSGISSAGSGISDPDFPGRAGTKILLSKNFRSRSCIIDAVNFIFSRIMSDDFGEMEYTEREYLTPGREDGFGGTVELDIIDMSGAQAGEDEENPDKTMIEARFVAERIKELVCSGYMIPGDQGGKREVRYSDIVILLRSMRGKAWQYAAALAEQGIPADMPGVDAFFETVEISAALSLLSVIDNPMQDIPLAATLRGPVYGFSADELAKIRAGSRGTDFYSALVREAETNASCAAFLEEIESLRVVMPDMPADRFIWHVYNKTGLLGRVSAMRGGGRRRNNLILLAEYARMFEQNGYKGLFSFLTYIRGLEERGAELAGGSNPVPETSVNDAVRVMSIHKSKGLEFPVVVLADTSKQFNYKDTQQPVLIHNKLGLGPKRVDPQRRIEYATISRMSVQNKLTSEMLAEELRVLYVAMTRAREKLIITATLKDAEKELGKLSATGIARTSGEKIPPQVLEEAKSVAEWILLPLLGGESVAEAPEPWQVRIITAQGSAYDVFPVDTGSGARSSELSGTSDDGSDGESGPFPRHSGETGDTGDSGETGDTGNSGDADPELHIPNANPTDVEMLRERFSFVYPHRIAVELPSKLTVTGLKDRDYDQEAAVLAPESGVKETAPKRSFSPISPEYIARESTLTAAERGTALHQAMQYIDFHKCENIEGVGGEIGRLTSMGLLSEKQAASVDTLKITRFLGSDVGKRLLKAEYVRREFRFSLLCPASRYYPGGGDDKILLQGVIDCFFEEDGEVCIIDFKTDRIVPGALEEKAVFYSPQLAAYSEALERITGKRVRERIIYFFDRDISVKV